MSSIIQTSCHWTGSIFIFAKFLLASALNKSETNLCMVCFTQVLYTKTTRNQSSVFLKAKIISETGSSPYLSWFFMWRTNISISVIFLFGIFKQLTNRDQTDGKLLIILSFFRLRKLPRLIQCDWHIVPVGEEVEHVVRVHGPKVGNACREK